MPLSNTFLPRPVLVFYSLSRIARSNIDAHLIAQRIEKAGASMASLTESFDTSSAMGAMLYGILASLAQFERDLISERTQGALAYKRSQGEKTGGQVPYGFRAVEAERRGRIVKVLDLHPQEQAILALARKLRAKGLSLKATAERMNGLGHGTRRGTPWTAPRLCRLLKRPEPIIGVAVA